MTRDALREHLERMGHTVAPASLDEIYAALPVLEAMRRRVRRGYDRAAEPAHTFDAAASGTPGTGS
ncbi:hypothetical protein [Acuticoccus sp.]|uniref:hypothetical protein n=1 Tax=Acuticoccus sp. TaxID=1904378 RepID=UPI003B52108E